MKRVNEYAMLLGMAVCLWMVVVVSSAHAQSVKKVLLLNSYNYTLEWTRSITLGVAEVLEANAPELQLRVEFMDTKNYNSPADYERVASILQAKYSGDKIDVIVSSDDNAVNFLLQHREKLFPGIPIVFCGVNNTDLVLRDDFKNITGIFETIDIVGTLRAALKFQPGTKHVYVINDLTTTGKINRVKLMKVMPEFRESVVFHWLEGLSADELKEQLAHLPDDSIVLKLSFNQDAQGKTFTHHESMVMVRSVCQRPVFGLWDFYLGDGIVGGDLTSGEFQGRGAAELALRVLDGERADSIPPQGQSANRYMFDYTELERFDFDLALLPDGALVVNKPESFWEAYKFQIVVVSAILFALVLIIALLLLNMRTRHIATQELESLNLYQEQLIEDRTQELTQRSRELELANHELKRMDELKTAVLNTVSHDLRTPLTAVLGFCKLISRDFHRYFMPLSLGDKELTLKGQRIDENLTIIADEGERLTRLINDFLDLSKIESGRIAWNDISLDPTTALRQATMVLRGYFTNADVTLEMVIPDGLPHIIADPDRLLQVMTNLVGNSAKFTSRGTVTVSATTTEAGWLQVSVADTGIGVPLEELDQIFEKFYQVNEDAGAQVHRGSGMGLAICKRIVEHYRGRIWAASNVEQGTIIHFVLPSAD